MSDTPDHTPDHNHLDDELCDSCGEIHPRHMMLDLGEIDAMLGRDDIPADARKVIAKMMVTVEALVDGYSEARSDVSAARAAVACLIHAAGGEVFVPSLTVLQYEPDVPIQSEPIHDGAILTGHIWRVDMKQWDENVRKGMN